MQVLNEFIKSDLTEDQILPILRELLPVLLGILGSTQVKSIHERMFVETKYMLQHTPMTRARAVSVFRQCITTLYMVKEQHPQAVKEATGSILPVWIDAFKVLLNASPQNDVENVETWDALAIRIEIFKVSNAASKGLSLTFVASDFRYDSYGFCQVVVASLQRTFEHRTRTFASPLAHIFPVLFIVIRVPSDGFRGRTNRAFHAWVPNHRLCRSSQP